MNTLELVLGGARSGKSRYAEQQMLRLEQQYNRPVMYVATAQCGDGEMSERIRYHRDSRPQHWHTREEPIRLADCLQQITAQQPQAVVMVDCLTLWLTNCLLSEDKECWPQQKTAFLRCLTQFTQPLVLVSNETGQGVVPMGELSRRFVDESGWLHQAIAELAGQVTLVSAGLPLPLKRNGQPLHQAATLID